MLIEDQTVIRDTRVPATKVHLIGVDSLREDAMLITMAKVGEV